MKKRSYVLVVLLLFLSISPILAQNHSRNQFEVLIYTSPDKWHNITEPVAIPEFQKMANRHAFGLTLTQIRDNFNDEYLKKFDVIVFLHSTTKDFSTDQLASFQRYIRGGGGFVGIHGASACRNEGEWYRKLVGRTFTDHPEEQSAVLNVVNKKHPSTMHLPDQWIWTDEWYSFTDALTPNLKLLLQVDEATYDPDRTWDDDQRKTAMGKFHPIAWYQEYDGGRSFYTSLGHMAALYNDIWFLDHIYGGIYWAATGLGVTK